MTGSISRDTNTNPFADDPTVASTYSGGRWLNKGRTYTTEDVAGVQQQLADTSERIRSRNGLSDEGKRVQLARIYREARDAVASMKQAERDRVDSERRRLGRKLFGHQGDADPTTAVSRRDAADRAAKLDKPQDAEHALRRAERGGDTHLAQAIAAHAAEHGWNTVLDAYTAQRPDAAEAVQAMRALPDTSDGMWRMQQAMTYSVMQPAELNGLSDHGVNALADTQLDVE